MQKSRCPALRSAVCLLPVALLALSAAAVISKERTDDGVERVVFPPDRAVLLSGSFDVVCKAKQAALKVDGKPHKWEGFKPPLRVSRLSLVPGLHELEIGSRRLEVVVALNDDEHEGPEDWEIVHSHPTEPDDRRCATCHKAEKSGGQLLVGQLKSSEDCLKCHTEVDFEVAHGHLLQPLEACQMCHDLHKSKHKSLLKAPPKKLCNRCHDS